MRKWLQGFKEPKRLRILSFWGPAGIAVGVICILNVFNITAKSISFEPTNGMTNFIAGIVLIILGLAMSLLAQEKVLFARAGLPAGLSLFFWGTHVINIYNTGLGLWIGWGVIILGIVLLGMAFRWAPK
jgi:hypothetical protein